jgi:hypothetical protein
MNVRRARGVVFAALLSMLVAACAAPPKVRLATDGSAAVVQRQLEAYNRQDVDAFVACYAEDVRIEREGPGEVAVGRAAMRERYAALFARNPQNRCAVLQRIVVGASVVDEEWIEGRGGEPFRVIVVYTVRDGVIVRVRFLE